MTLIIAIHPTPTAPPTKPLPTYATNSEGDNEKHNAPMKVKNAELEITRNGPYLSINMPYGICTIP